MLFLALGDAKVPDARYFAFWWNIGLKVTFNLTRNPNASQWNIGCVGSLALGLCIGHVHFKFCVLISFALGSRGKCTFQWNMGFSVTEKAIHVI